MRTILFAGHRLDAEDRPAPRFPAEMEAPAGEAIRDAVADIVRCHGSARGIAGGASGGDILFHEACGRLGIPSELYLPMGEDAFIAESVAPAGADWVQRFAALATRVPRVFYHHPPEHDGRDGEPARSIWEQNNQWLLHEALSDGADNLTVLVLWDGHTGDGPGGTEDLVHAARLAGAEVVILDATTLQSHVGDETTRDS
jgi:hypothetical protein